MPELPEVEITARRLSAALAGAEVESALAPGMVVAEDASTRRSTPSPGARIAGVRRIGKMPVVDFDVRRRRRLRWRCSST